MGNRKAAIKAKPGKPISLSVRFIGPGQAQGVIDLSAFVDSLNEGGFGGTFSLAGIARDILIRFSAMAKADPESAMALLYGKQTGLFEELFKKKPEKKADKTARKRVTRPTLSGVHTAVEVVPKSDDVEAKPPKK